MFVCVLLRVCYACCDFVCVRVGLGLNCVYSLLVTCVLDWATWVFCFARGETRYNDSLLIDFVSWVIVGVVPWSVIVCFAV